MENRKAPDDLKYLFATVIVSLITIFIFLFVDDLRIKAMSFTTLSLFLTLNAYVAYLKSNDKKYKIKLIVSLFGFIVLLILTLIIFLRK